MPNRVENDWADPPLADRARNVTPPRSLTIVKVALAILTALGLTLAENVSRIGKHLTSRTRANFGGIGSRIARRLASRTRANFGGIVLRFKRRLADLSGRLLPINTLCFVGG